MLTPFTENNEVDYESLGRLVDWYIANKVDGLFAVCQSSEMFFLSDLEAQHITQFVVDHVAGRVPVISSGHTSLDTDTMVQQIENIYATGVEAVVLLTNRFANPHENGEIWKARVTKLLDRLSPDIPLAFYECPYPYAYGLTPELLKWAANTGRFHFLKDTSCDIDVIGAKQKAVEGMGIKIFNAHSGSLLPSLRDGIAGFCGVMANFYPQLYHYVTHHFQDDPKGAENAQNVITLGALIERQCYPLNAKYFLQQLGVFSSIYSRTRISDELDQNMKNEIASFKVEMDKLVEEAIR